MAEPTDPTKLFCDLWLDLGDPQSYLALNGLRKAAAKLEGGGSITVNVRPFFTQNTTLDAKKRERLLEEAASEGIALNLDARGEVAARAEESSGSPQWMGTLPAQMLIAFARELDEGSGKTVGADTLELRVAEGLLRTAFEVGADITNPEVVIAVGQDYGIPGAQGLGAVEDEGLAQEILSQFELGAHLGFDEIPIVTVNDGLRISGSYNVEQFERSLESAQRFYAGEERSTDE